MPPENVLHLGSGHARFEPKPHRQRVGQGLLCTPSRRDRRRAGSWWRSEAGGSLSRVVAAAPPAQSPEKQASICSSVWFFLELPTLTSVRIHAPTPVLPTYSDATSGRLAAELPTYPTNLLTGFVTVVTAKLRAEPRARRLDAPPQARSALSLSTLIAHKNMAAKNGAFYASPVARSDRSADRLAAREGNFATPGSGPTYLPTGGLRAASPSSPTYLPHPVGTGVSYIRRKRTKRRTKNTVPL